MLDVLDVLDELDVLDDHLPDAVQVLDAFHVVKLGTQVVDEVRRRLQQQQLGRRGHKDDPLYKIRGLLRHGVEHLNVKQQARLHAGLLGGDPHCEVELAWACYQRLRAVYAGTASLRERKKLAEQLLDTLHTCPIPEVARLGRTLRAWRAQVLTYFETEACPTAAPRRSTCLSRRPGASATATGTQQLPAGDAPRR